MFISRAVPIIIKNNFCKQKKKCHNSHFGYKIKKEFGFSLQVLIFFFTRLKTAIYLVLNYSKIPYAYCN